MLDIFILPWLFLRVCWNQGIGRALQMTFAKLSAGALRAKTKFPQALPSNASAYLQLLQQRPLISLIMPVRDSAWLDQALASVLQQSYQHFELLLVDDASSRPATQRTLAAATADPRVKLIRNPQALGISAATNLGLAAAAGAYVAFMDHDDLLHHDALALFVRTLNAPPAERPADIFYSDENLIDRHGYIIGVTRKCAITLDLLLSVNAVGHLCIIRAAALRRLGALKSEYDGAQDHELMLRAWEQGLTFQHLPYLLYGWRMHPAAMSAGTRRARRGAAATWPRAYLSGKAMLQAYLDRQGWAAQVSDDGFPWYRVRYAIAQPEEVAIIVPFKDRPDQLRRLLRSLAKTSYPHYRLFLVNNRSRRPETLAYLKELRQDPRITLLEFEEPFNYSRLYNQVVAQVANEILLFLNNDMEVIQADWIEAMLEHIQRAGVGAVGCRLLKDRRTLQHGGLAFQPSLLGGVRNLTDPVEFYTRVQRDVSGVTAACMMIRKSVFKAVGGFDEIHWPIGFSDAELCLKLRRAGLKIIYTPFAVLLHHESRSRALQEEVYEMATLWQRYGGASLMHDRHYPTQFLEE